MRSVVLTLGITSLIVAWPGAAFGQATHPSAYVVLQEETQDGRRVDVASTGLKAEIDRASDILVTFNRAKLHEIVKQLPTGDKVAIRIEATITRVGATQSTPVAIDNYYMLAKDRAGTITEITVSEQAIINNAPEITGFIPDAVLDLTSHALMSGDVVRLRITNVQTQESVDKLMTARSFGLVGEVKDSFFFLKRLNVSTEDTADGLDSVNFGPAPGVSYLWTVSTRRQGFWRVVRPSLGVNVSFTDWDDPAFNQATGQFAAGTNASDIEITAGGVVGLFDGVLQLTVGSNLNVEKKRGYFGIGFSFVNVVDRLGKLIAKK